MSFRVLLPTSCLYLLWCIQPAFADSLEIREWLVPWKKSLPSDPYVDSKGRVWFVGQKGNFIGNMTPEDGLFNRYDLLPDGGPNSLLVDAQRNIWFSANLGNYIGKLSPSTAQAQRIEMPNSRATGPHSLAFDAKGNIWFTIQKGNFIGKLNTNDGSIALLPIASKKAKPYGIIVDANDMPWAAASGSNRLLRIFPATMSIAEVELPDKKSRPRRLVATSNGDIWYADTEQGKLGRYRPSQNDFMEWQMPGGKKARPYGMAVDRNDRIWIVETGKKLNRFVGFDSASEKFLSGTDIPSGGGSVRHLFYREASGEIWFGTDSNYIGRAKVH